MSYKTIFTVWDGTREGHRAFEVAVDLAREVEGHLDVLCLGVDRMSPGFYFAGTAPELMADSVREAREEATRREAEARQQLEPEDISWAVRPAIAQYGGIADVVNEMARFADLTVLARPYGRGNEEEHEAVFEAALLDAATPVLVVPPDIAGLQRRRITIGWNRAPEALRAAKVALPWLCAAQAVEVAVIDPPRHEEDRPDPGTQLATYLGRHGANVEVSILPLTVPRVSDALISHARAKEADLIVMGGYGKSRFREAILGGTTRDMLRDSPLPVLMAH